MNMVREIKKCPMCGKVPELRLVEKMNGRDKDGEIVGLSLGCSGFMNAEHCGMGFVQADTADKTVKKWNHMVEKMIKSGVVQKNLLRKYVLKENLNTK